MLLVIEDEPVLAGLLVGALEKAGFACVVARDGATAAAALMGDTSWDMLLVDVMLAGPFDGTELIAAASKTMEAMPPVLFLTGLGDEEALRHFAASIGAEIMSKPFRASAVVDLVKKKLGA